MVEIQEIQAVDQQDHSSSELLWFHLWKSAEAVGPVVGGCCHRRIQPQTSVSYNRHLFLTCGSQGQLWPGQGPAGLILLLMLGLEFMEQLLAGCAVHTQGQKLKSTCKASVPMWEPSYLLSLCSRPGQALYPFNSLHLIHSRCQPFPC